MGTPEMRSGEPTRIEAINWWADVSQRSIILRAKHSRDGADQAVAQIVFDDGVVTLVSRGLYARNLCDALGLKIGTALPIRQDEPQEPKGNGE